MRQPSLFEVLRGVRRAADAAGAAAGAVQVTDLFCGLGGFSCGAKLVGCTVVFACDSDALALETYRLNHPEVATECGALPDSVRVPPPAAGVHSHLHGSPPCQMFSAMRAETTAKRTANDAYDAALGLVEWFVRFAAASAFDTWSMEQVASPETVSLLERLRREQPARVAFGVIDMARLGVPQHRTRLIAGSPALVASLLRAQSDAKIRSVAAAIRTPRGTHVRNGKSWATRTATGGYRRATLFQNSRSVGRPCFTVVGNGDLRWVTPTKPNSRGLRLTIREKAALQTFPASYSLPLKLRLACRLVGNAVPPLFASLLMRAAAPQPGAACVGSRDPVAR